jgi:hypothetical protein
MELGYNPYFFGSPLGCKFYQGRKVVFNAWRLEENKTPQIERDPCGKVKNLHLQQTGKSKQKKTRQIFVDRAI